MTLSLMAICEAVLGWAVGAAIGHTVVVAWYAYRAPGEYIKP